MVPARAYKGATLRDLFEHTFENGSNFEHTFDRDTPDISVSEKVFFQQNKGK